MSNFDPNRPAPTSVSAIRDGESVAVTFTDAATDETLVSAYCTSDGDVGPTMTLNIASGQRSAVLTIPTSFHYLRLRNMWGTLPGDGSDIVWGPFSDRVSVNVSAETPTTKKAHPHK